MSQFRKFAIALIALSVIASATVATAGIEVLKPGIEVLGIEVLSEHEFNAHALITDAPEGAMAFGFCNDGINEFMVSATPINPAGPTPVYFPMRSLADKIVVGFMTPDGIEVLSFGWIEDELAWN